MNKHYKPIINAIEAMIGVDATGRILAGVADTLSKTVEGKTSCEVRSMKIVINNFFETELLEETR